LPPGWRRKPSHRGQGACRDPPVASPWFPDKPWSSSVQGNGGSARRAKAGQRPARTRRSWKARSTATSRHQPTRIPAGPATGPSPRATDAPGGPQNKTTDAGTCQVNLKNKTK
jgi:hypothetical protein